MQLATNVKLDEKLKALSHSTCLHPEQPRKQSKNINPSSKSFLYGRFLIKSSQEEEKKNKNINTSSSNLRIVYAIAEIPSKITMNNKSSMICDLIISQSGEIIKKNGFITRWKVPIITIEGLALHQVQVADLQHYNN